MLLYSESVNDLFFGEMSLSANNLSLNLFDFGFILMYLLLSALFYFAPYKKKYFKFFSAGSTFSTIMLVVLLKGLNYYFANFTSYNLVYGSIGAILLILIWINWSCVTVLIGFDLNVSIAIAQQKRINQNDELKIISTVKE